MTRGIGYFLGKGDIVHKERVTMCSSYCTVATLEEKGPEINRLANSMSIEFEQESLAVVIDGEMLFFQPTAEYRRRYAVLKADVAAGKKKASGYDLYISKDLPI